jgi:hypothetical protein
VALPAGLVSNNNELRKVDVLSDIAREELVDLI